MMKKNTEKGSGKGTGKGKGKTTSSNQEQRARDIGSTFSQADGEVVATDLTVEGLVPALCALRAEIARRRAETAAGAGGSEEAEADLWDLNSSGDALNMLGATNDDMLLAYLRWAINPAPSDATGGAVGSTGKDTFNVSRAARRLEKLAKFGQKHNRILTEPPLDLVEMEKVYQKWGIVCGTNPTVDGRIVIALEFDAMDMETICEDKGAPTIRLFWYLIHAIGKIRT